EPARLEVPAAPVKCSRTSRCRRPSPPLSARVRPVALEQLHRERPRCGAPIRRDQATAPPRRAVTSLHLLQRARRRESRGIERAGFVARRLSIACAPRRLSRIDVAVRDPPLPPETVRPVLPDREAHGPSFLLSAPPRHRAVPCVPRRRLSVRLRLRRPPERAQSRDGAERADSRARARRSAPRRPCRRRHRLPACTPAPDHPKLLGTSLGRSWLRVPAVRLPHIDVAVLGFLDDATGILTGCGADP